MKKGDTYEYSTEIELFEVQAPLKSDQRLGVLMILDKNNIVIDEINLVSKRDIEKIKISEILDKIYFEW